MLGTYFIIGPEPDSGLLTSDSWNHSGRVSANQRRSQPSKVFQVFVLLLPGY